MQQLSLINTWSDPFDFRACVSISDRNYQIAIRRIVLELSTQELAERTGLKILTIKMITKKYQRKILTGTW